MAPHEIGEVVAVVIAIAGMGLLIKKGFVVGSVGGLLLGLVLCVAGLATAMVLLGPELLNYYPSPPFGP